MPDLSCRRIAVLATDGFEEAELTQPCRKLRQTGARVDIVSLQPGEIRSWRIKEWGDPVPVDCAIDEVTVEDYDALILPGGQINPDVLRADPRAVEFVRDFVAAGKTVAAICHGPWLLVEADAVEGRRVTSYHSIRTDVRNAGAEWVDEPVVTDGNLITSRHPGDIPAFIDKIVEAMDIRAEIATAGA